MNLKTVKILMPDFLRQAPKLKELMKDLNIVLPSFISFKTETIVTPENEIKHLGHSLMLYNLTEDVAFTVKELCEKIVGLGNVSVIDQLKGEVCE